MNTLSTFIITAFALSILSACDDTQQASAPPEDDKQTFNQCADSEKYAIDVDIRLNPETRRDNERKRVRVCNREHLADMLTFKMCAFGDMNLYASSQSGSGVDRTSGRLLSEEDWNWLIEDSGEVKHIEVSAERNCPSRD